MGYKANDRLIGNCLTFADVLTLLAPTVEECEATRQCSSLNHIAAQVELRIALNKPNFNTNIRDAFDLITLDNTAIRNTNLFQNLEGWIIPNISEDVAMNSRCTTLERVYHL